MLYNKYLFMYNKYFIRYLYIKFLYTSYHIPVSCSIHHFSMFDILNTANKSLYIIIYYFKFNTHLKCCQTTDGIRWNYLRNTPQYHNLKSGSTKYNSSAQVKSIICDHFVNPKFIYKTFHFMFRYYTNY